MCFTDLHTHILANVDDGAENEAEMYDLLDTMYRDGTRCICCTPHYHPGYYGENQKKSLDKFQQLSKYADSRYPDLKLCLGNELHYSQGCLEWIEKGFCRTLNGSRYILVDFHAEATSEKRAMGYLLEGKVTAVFGTHTHIQTADEQVLPGGTAIIADAGMVGGVRSVLGRDVDAVLKKFTSGMPNRLPVVENNIMLNAVIVTYDYNTGRASAIERISEIYNPA